jgi:8-oxo-dGTP diphosphatase
VDEGETADAALSRELHEELGIEVQRAYPWITRVFVYAHATVRLNFFRVAAWGGDPHPKEEQAIRWQWLDQPMVEPMLPANAPVLRALALPLEYAITDAQALGGDAMLARIERRLSTGLRLVQVRDKALSDRAKFARSVIEIAHSHGAKILVNGDEQTARALGADGVHWSAAALDHAKSRPADMLCGASCHTAAELERACRARVRLSRSSDRCATPTTHAGVATLTGTDSRALRAARRSPCLRSAGCGRPIWTKRAAAGRTASR